MDTHSFSGFAKKDILDAINRLPEDATLEDAYYSLYVLKKVESGLLDAEAGRLHSDEEVQQFLGLCDSDASGEESLGSV